MIKLRKESPRDAPAIHQLTTEAFLHAPHTAHTEQYIVDALRKAGRLSVSLVAEEDGVIVGHVALSPLSISDGSEGWYGLGPISVTPARQRQGIGTELMTQALAELRALGASGCVLVGDPGFYSRFGFKAQPSLVLPDVPPEYVLALAFDDDVPVGRIAFHEAFAARG